MQAQSYMKVLASSRGGGAWGRGYEGTRYMSLLEILHMHT